MSSNPYGVLFARYVRALAVAKGDPLSAQAYADGRGRAWYSTPEVANALKALTGPVGTDDYTAAQRAVWRDFAEFLRPRTVVGRLQGIRRVPFKVRMIAAGQGTGAGWVGEEAPIPVSAMDLTDGGEQLFALKSGGIAVVTMELVRNSDPVADGVVAADVGRAIAAAMDLAFIDPANGGTTDVKPPSVTHGATSFESSGTSVAAIDGDLKLMLQVLTDAELDLATAAWVMHPTTAASLALKRGTNNESQAFAGMTARGGTLLGLPVITSTACAATGSPGERFIALVEASEILLADDGESELTITGDASLQMNDAPSAGAQQLVSLWQNGLVGIRGLRFMNWKRRRSAAVAVLRSVGY